MFSVIALGLGLATLVYALYVRRESERTRRLIAQKGTLDERLAFVFLPGLALLFLGMGALQIAVLLPPIPQSVALTICAASVLVGFVLLTIALFKIPYPKKVVPAWARALAAQRDAGKLPGSLTAPRPDWTAKKRQKEAEERRLKRAERRERKARQKGPTSPAKKRRPR